ncbi:MAG TPA: glycine/sarcosine/betaine reductase selenoprotein B family protein [Symbiobacteriaceae bacterium]|nr:glycine/sarcosine/betaine reductase selenoprotein B family protein [Symbiobacteriaceae bacterium]
MADMSRRCVPYTPVTRKLSEMTIAIVSTAGVHLKDQEPFNTQGDDTWRVLPGDVNVADLMITHGAPEEHYDRTQANQDMNVIFPIERLRELQAEGFIGGVAEKNLTLMGYSLRLQKYYNETAPAVAKEIERSPVDAVLLTAG